MVTIFDCRPPRHPNLTEWSKVRVAQLRYNADTYHWSLYWAVTAQSIWGCWDGTSARYEPIPDTGRVLMLVTPGIRPVRS
jgi:hypothetical protein